MHAVGHGLDPQFSVDELQAQTVGLTFGGGGERLELLGFHLGIDARAVVHSTHRGPPLA
ncbi:hypothetical protein GTY65_40405 [Streptomyces sp. SID8379]|uniref:hypothetical protein n=1 Tax=unclassified Streptomyces TaxID=2593676 RepID=UPI00131A14DB|nr:MULTISPECIES: hypothetical protein [unclassified Streptomyces]MYW70268.1 hypothetical protein [Streptomyces sp. SID8379]